MVVAFVYFGFEMCLNLLQICLHMLELCISKLIEKD